MPGPNDNKSDQNKGGGAGGENIEDQKDKGENKGGEEDQNKGGEKLDLTDVNAVNQKLGELQKTVKDFDEYKKKVEPILTAIYRDPKVYAEVNKSYQVLMGVKPKDEDQDGENKDAKDEEDKKEDKKDGSSSMENDNRNALIAQTVQSWEKDNGIDKLKPEDKSTLNNKVLTELKVLLDPSDIGKSGADLLAGIPVAKVRNYLDRAYYLATREEREASLKESAVKEHQDGERGLIPSISGGSISESDVKLTEKERQIAKRQGVSEEKYLVNKKEILKRKGSIA